MKASLRKWTNYEYKQEQLQPPLQKYPLFYPFHCSLGLPDGWYFVNPFLHVYCGIDTEGCKLQYVLIKRCFPRNAMLAWLSVWLCMIENSVMKIFDGKISNHMITKFSVYQYIMWNICNDLINLHCIQYLESKS